MQTVCRLDFTPQIRSLNRTGSHMKSTSQKPLNPVSCTRTKIFEFSFSFVPRGVMTGFKNQQCEAVQVDLCSAGMNIVPMW